MTEINSIGQYSHQWAQKENLASEYLDATTSTNDLAKNQASQNSTTFRVYFTDHQSAGRGRNNNTWMSPRSGSSLLSTWCWSLDQSPQHITAPLFGLALYRAAKTTWPSLEWSLKAPNDLYLGVTKVAGLLVETVSFTPDRFCLLVGLGFNVLTKPENIDHAGCLADNLGNNLTADKWFSFLNTLFSQWQWAAQACLKKELKSTWSQELLIALNANPLKKDIILEISPQADLITDNETISWYSL